MDSCRLKVMKIVDFVWEPSLVGQPRRPSRRNRQRKRSPKLRKEQCPPSHLVIAAGMLALPPPRKRCHTATAVAGR